jgi:hypothetical protein
MGALIIDSNLLLLLIVGSTSREYIPMHGNLSHYDERDFDTLIAAISLYSDIVLVPHVMAEVSSLARQIKNPARRKIQETLRELVETTVEIPIPSVVGVRRGEFDRLGLTDALLLSQCAASQSSLAFSLLTADNKLAIEAEMLGLDVLNFRHLQ